jgi:hypothetical protein
MDQKRCQQVPVVAGFTEDDLIAGHAAYEAYLINKDKGESVKGIPKFNPKVDFNDWHKLVTETLSMIHGAQYTGIAYVIRPDKPAEWNPITDANTDYECPLYQLLLHGPKYEVDNASVFTLIYTSVLKTPAFTSGEALTLARDGRGAMLALCSHFDSPAETHTRIQKHLNRIQDLKYTNECQMPFNTMITQLNESYQFMMKQGQTYMDTTKVDDLIRCNVAVTVALETMRTLHLNNYTGAVNYITARLSEINTSYNRSAGSTRHISETRTEFNGIDLRDPFCSFTPDEWHCLGAQGQQILQDLR